MSREIKQSQPIPIKLQQELIATLQNNTEPKDSREETIRYLHQYREGIESQVAELRHILDTINQTIVLLSEWAE